jgi:diguanylate cyclase (GGDEF)-like protein/PAS domain S-box-containing protein
MLSPFAFNQRHVKATESPIVRDIPDGTYVELVASLCGTRMPAVIMTLLFLMVGALSVRASQDIALASLVAMGACASVARLVVLIRGRRLCNNTEMPLVAAQRFERQFALTYWAFAAVFGLFAARSYMLPPAEWQMPIGILVVGYAAGAASTVAMRPYIVVPSLIFAVTPPAAILLFRGDANASVSSLCLFALLTGGLRSARQRYRSQSAKATTRHAFARQVKTDHLTGLGNRLALAEAFETNARPERPARIAFHYVDLDDFKPVNDRLGHQVGDSLLCLVADRLRACSNPGDVVVRLGGDEFVVVQINSDSDLDVERQRLRTEQALNGSYVVEGHFVNCAASVGSSRCTGNSQTMNCLLMAADEVLRRRKAERKIRLASPPVDTGSGKQSDAIDNASVAERCTDNYAFAHDILSNAEAYGQLAVTGIAATTWESAPDGLIETDSPSWRAYTGQSYDDWKGYGWLTAIHPDDRLATMEKWRETVHDQQAVDAEYRLRGKSGQYRWMSVHAVPMRAKDGRIVRWLGINIDIDDRKQLELANHIGSFPA